jgi:hypothetical protein
LETVTTAALTPPPLRRTLDATMTAGFAMGKELVADLTRLGGGKSMAFSFAIQFLVVKFWVYA